MAPSTQTPPIDTLPEVTSEAEKVLPRPSPSAIKISESLRLQRLTPKIPATPVPFQWDENISGPDDMRSILSNALFWVGSFMMVAAGMVLALKLLSVELRRPPTGASLEPSPRAAPQKKMLTAPSEVPKQVVSTQNRPLRLPVANPQAVSEPPLARPVETPVSAEELIPIPENLAARIDSPTMVELSWDSVGSSYRYRLYSSSTDLMVDSVLETENPIVNAHFVWSPATDIQDVWLAVTSLDAENHESPMSEPMYLRLR